MQLVALDADAVEVEPKRPGRGLADEYRRVQEPQNSVQPVEVLRVVAGLPGLCGIRTNDLVQDLDGATDKTARQESIRAG